MDSEDRNLDNIQGDGPEPDLMDRFANLADDASEEDIDELFRAFQTLDAEISTTSLSDTDALFEGLEMDAAEGGESVNEDDLDAMLKSLMAQEEEAEPWTPSDDLEKSLMPETEIFEGESANQELDLSVFVDESKRKKRGLSPLTSIRWAIGQFKAGDLVTKILIASIMFLSAVTLAATVTLSAMLFLTGFQRQEARAFAITPPPYAFNNASHASVHLTVLVGDESITLSRMLLDELATVFYFAGDVDLTRFVLTMEDFNGRVYGREIVYAMDHTRNYLLEQTEVRFEALDREARGFTLFITDLRTGITADLDLSFESDAISPGRYLIEPIEVETGLQGVVISIDSGNFSALGSFLNFSIRHNMPDADLVFAAGGTAAPVSLNHAGFMVPPVNTDFNAVHYNGVTLGAMDFSPLRSLMGRVDVSFGQVYKQYHLNLTMEAAEMLVAGPNRARSIELSNHIINIAGLTRQGYYFVMPLHGLQRGGEYEDNVRMPTTMTATLVGFDSEGNEIRLPANVLYDFRGTDVLFDTRENPAITSIPARDLFVEIENVSVRLPDLHTSIELGQLGFANDEHIAAITAAIEREFGANSRLLAEFGQRQNLEYRAQVRQLNFHNGFVYARVLERLAFNDGGEMTEVLREHVIRR